MKKQSGFTILELLVVTTIVAVLSSVLIGNLRTRANSLLTEQTIDEVNHIIDASQNYQFDRLSWPDEANNCAGLIAELSAQGFLNNVDTTNPFGNNYSFTCTPQLLTINNSADENDWAQSIAGALPATTVAGVNTTTIIPRSGAIPAIVNKLDRNGVDGGMTANLDLNSNSIVEVTNIQTTQINGLNVSEYQTPPLQVSFFQRPTCPPGWTFYGPAQGRTLVGTGLSDSFFSYLSSGGASAVTLTVAQIPNHNHGSGWGESSAARARHGVVSSARGFGSAATDGDNLEFLTSSVGGGLAHENRMPFHVLMPCVKL